MPSPDREQYCYYYTIYAGVCGARIAHNLQIVRNLQDCADHLGYTLANGKTPKSGNLRKFGFSIEKAPANRFISRALTGKTRKKRDNRATI